MTRMSDDGLRGYQVGAVGAVRAELRALSVGDDREGMLEGTPHLHRRFRLQAVEKAMAATPHLYVHDLEKIRADVAERSEEWLPREAAHARLTSWWTPVGLAQPGHTELRVMWFQTAADDPFARLAAIVRPLDWAALARFVPWED
ncbi:hypothetical protein [Streptomyces yangpuensis]|uniref:hypothetical protein n=1 Tax=Streptomyces yangpuensis TaxID=1648182 RepID=UPI000A95376B|nr:hypothetical protein [Streptomyces yangpuensis]